jgi:hypothetical protein
VNNPIKMFFTEVEDPRKGANILYPLEEILLVAIVTFLMSGEGFEDMEDVGEYWLEELRKYYPFKRERPARTPFGMFSWGWTQGSSGIFLRNG